MNGNSIDPLIAVLRDRLLQLQGSIAQLPQTSSQSADLTHTLESIDAGLQQIQAEGDRSSVLQPSCGDDRFTKAFHSNPIPTALSILETGQLLEVNARFLELSGYQREEITHKTTFELGLWVNPEERLYWMEQLRQQKSIQNIEIQFRTRSGEILETITSLELFEIDGELCTLTQVCDVTEKNRAERALRESEAKLSAVLESAIGVINRFRVFQDCSWEYDYFSPGTELIFGYSPEEMLADHRLWVSRVLEQDLQQAVYPAYDDIFSQRTTTIEYRFSCKDGQLKWLSSTIFSCRDEAANCWIVTSVHFDITNRKRIEAQLQASLREKEVLLKEVHHRVKNNLQVISSLLDLQSQQSSDTKLKEAFRESQNRIRSMAIIHEKLYQSDHLSKVDFADYIRSLIIYLLESYTVDYDRITLSTHLESAVLNLDTAIPCGLILNELISNALKHAFPDGRNGAIWVTLRILEAPSSKSKTPAFELVVGNDGIPLPTFFSFANRDSLGVQLVNLLTEQIQGQLEVRQEKGVNFVLRFSDSSHHSETHDP